MECCKRLTTKVNDRFFPIILRLTSIYFEYWNLSLSCIDLDFILGEVEIFC
jgi:hypothetical protein